LASPMGTSTTFGMFKCEMKAGRSEIAIRTEVLLIAEAHYNDM